MSRSSRIDDFLLLSRTRTVLAEYLYTRYHTAYYMELPRPYPKAVRSSLLLQGKGTHSYILHHTRPDCTVSRQHHNNRLHIRRHTTWPPSVTLHSQSRPTDLRTRARTLTETHEATPPSTNNTLPEPSVRDSPPSGQDVTPCRSASLRKYPAIPTTITHLHGVKITSH
jgi:hypothetical protein